MNINAKILNQILANQIQYDQMIFIRGRQRWFNVHKSIIMYTILTKWRIKNHISNTEKAFDKIQHSFMIKEKKLSTKGYRRNIPKHNKGHIWQIYS